MPKIRFNDLKVNEVSKSSGIFSGENMQVKWKFVSTHDEGFGKVDGDHNNLSSNKHIVKKINSLKG